MHLTQSHSKSANGIILRQGQLCALLQSKALLERAKNIKDGGAAEVKLVESEEGAIRSVTKRSSLETTFNMAAASSPSVLKHFLILLIMVRGISVSYRTPCI